jgi:hypothetical protein
MLAFSNRERGYTLLKIAIPHKKSCLPLLSKDRDYYPHSLIKLGAVITGSITCWSSIITANSLHNYRYSFAHVVFLILI